MYIFVISAIVGGLSIYFKSHLKRVFTAFRMFGYQDFKELAYLKFQTWLLNKMDIGILKKKGDNIYEVGYLDGIRKYKIIIQKKRGPAPYTKVSSDEVNITSEIKSYAGPSYDFHGAEITPHMLGRKNLSFHLRKGDILTFQQDDVIEI